MKRIWWIAKMAVLVAAMYCIFIPGGSVQRVRADDGGGGGGCDTSAPCARSNGGNNACYCTRGSLDGGGCKGCFVANLDTSCGTCSGGPSILD